MEIKFEDLELTMKYIAKEIPNAIQVKVDPFELHFIFKDLENRECTITLYEQAAPQLTKVMYLQTRIPNSLERSDNEVTKKD